MLKQRSYNHHFVKQGPGADKAEVGGKNNVPGPLSPTHLVNSYNMHPLLGIRKLDKIQGPLHQTPSQLVYVLSQNPQV